MNKKAGRPPLPEGRAKYLQVAARFNPDDKRQIKRAIAESGEPQTEAQFVRDAVRLVAAESNGG